MVHCGFGYLLFFCFITANVAKPSDIIRGIVRDDADEIVTKDIIREKKSELRKVLPPLKMKYKTYYVETQFQASWYKAMQFCRYHGMQLASIKSQEEQDAITNHLLKKGASPIDNYWTSGQNFAGRNSWVWSSTGSNVVYQNWQSGEPNNAEYMGEEEHCIEIERNESGEDYHWNDMRCSTPRFFICEKTLN